MSKKPTTTRLDRAGIVPRPGVFSRVEKNLIDHLVRDTPGEIAPAQVDALALALRRNPLTVAQHIELAKKRLQERALEYVDLHMESAKKALEIGEVGEARKAAEWALSKISAKDNEGKIVRIIDESSAHESGPAIQIGIALGGLPQPTRVIEAERVEE